MYEYVTSLGVSSAAEMTFMQKLKLSTMAIKEQAIAWATSPLGMATIAAAGIFAIVKAIEYLSTATERAQEEFKEIKQQYEETASEIEGLDSELQSVKKKLDEINNTDTPELVNKEETEKLEATKTLLDQQLALKRELALFEQKEAAEAAKKALTARNMYLTGGSVYTDNGIALPEIGYRDVLDELVANNDQLKYLEDSLAQAYTGLGTLVVGSSAYKQQESNIDYLKEQVESYSKIVAESKDEIFDLYMSLFDDQGNIIEGYEDIVARVKLVLDLDESSTESSTNAVNDMATSAEQAAKSAESLEKALEKLNKVADNGQTSIASLSDALTKLQDGTLTLSDIVDLLQDFPELAPYIDLDADGYGNLYEGLLETIKQTSQQTTNELLALKLSGDLSEEDAKSVDVLSDAIKRLANDALNSVIPKLDGFVDSLSKVQQASAGLDLLGGIYADVADGETFDWTAILNNEEFTKQFGGLGSAYTDFIKTISASNGDLNACQAAFDELTTAYIMNSGVLNEVTAETRDASVALLEEMGVANAATLVDAKLADNLVYLSEQTKTYVSTLLTEEQVLWDECGAGSAAAQSLANLVQQKLAFNASTINTTNDIKQLMNLAKYANATSTSIQRLAKAEEFMSQYYAMKDKNYSYAVSFLHQANALLSTPIEYEEYTANVVAKVEYSGGSEYLQKLKDETEKAAEDAEKAREEALKNAKSSIDELVEYRIDMLKKDIELEKDALDEKLDALKDFYDKQKEMLQDQYDEEQYLKEQKEKRESVSDIEAELARLDLDDSAWAQKRKLELREELVDAKDELQEYEEEHALDLALDALDDALQSQEAQIQAEMDALDDRLNDPHALFNQALNDIKTNTGALYNEMVIYNRKYGSGNDEDIADMYKEAQIALSEYKNIYGSNYKGVVLGSTSSGTSSGGSTGSPSGSVSKGESVTVKKTATHYGSKSGGKRMASFVPGSTYTVYETSSDQVLIGKNGSYIGWVKKSDIAGYASGTQSALPGFKQIDETGAEYTFVSSDGNRYRIFSGGEKVLNAKATNFLYDFATTGGTVISNMMSSLVDTIGLGKISKPSQAIALSTGDIIIQGNADHRTVSEIRRAQRENLEFVIKEFNKLNK